MDVLHTIEAENPAELNAKKQEYFRQYPSPGYGTWVYKKPEYDEEKNRWKMVIRRFRSCD